MRSTEDPPRLRESAETPAELRWVLDSLRADVPAPAHLRELRARLPRRTSRLAPRGTWGRALGACVVLLLAAFALRRAATEPRPHPRAAAPPPLPVKSAGPDSLSASRGPDDVQAPAPDRERGRAAAGGEVGGGEVDVGFTPDPRPRPRRRRACDVAAQVARLLRAQEALRAGDAVGALALCARDEDDCPGGALSEERERIRLEATLARGGDAEARAGFERFARRFPRSAYLDRLAALCTGRRDGGAP